MPLRTHFADLFRGAGISLVCLSATVFLLLVPLGWMLRDGLGPKAIETRGIEAVSRFLSEVWPEALFLTCVSAGGVLLYRLGDRLDSSVSLVNRNERV
jgi:hypothetical protein